MAAIDLQSGSQTPRAAREVQQTRSFSMLLHQRDSFQGLECANEDSAGRAFRFAGNVEHEVRTVVEKNVSVARGEIHRADARGRTTIVMAGGIAWRIGFGFDDASTQASCGQFAHYDFADQKAGQRDGGLRKLRTSKPADFWLSGSHKRKNTLSHETTKNDKSARRAPMPPAMNQIISYFSSEMTIFPKC